MENDFYEAKEKMDHVFYDMTEKDLKKLLKTFDMLEIDKLNDKNKVIIKSGKSDLSWYEE